MMTDKKRPGYKAADSAERDRSHTGGERSTGGSGGGGSGNKDNDDMRFQRSKDSDGDRDRKDNDNYSDGGSSRNSG